MAAKKTNEAVLKSNVQNNKFMSLYSAERVQQKGRQMQNSHFVDLL